MQGICTLFLRCGELYFRMIPELSLSCFLLGGNDNEAGKL